MTLRSRTQPAIMAFRRLGTAALSVLLVVALCSGCAPAGGCGAGEKCPGPVVPDMTVHLEIGGKSAALSSGQAMRAVAKRGRPTKITLSIATKATVSNVWLVVQSTRGRPSPAGANAPFAHFVVVLDRKGLLRSTETLSATWLPTAPSGRKTVNLGISIDLGDAGLSWPLATVTVRRLSS